MRVAKSFTKYRKTPNTYLFFHSQTMGDKLDSQERNSSHPLVRSQKNISVRKAERNRNISAVSLESAICLRTRNSAE